MANTCTSTPRRQRRRSPRRTPWMSERQLDAYIQAREILRRLRALAAAPASLTAATRDGSPPLSRD